MSSVEDLEQKLVKIKNEIESAKKLKEDLKDSTFTNEVNENLKNYDALKNKIGPIDSNFNLKEIAGTLDELMYIKFECSRHDVVDDPYGTWYVGPKAAHHVNMDLKKDLKKFECQLNERLRFLCVKYKWVREPGEYPDSESEEDS